MGGQMQGQGPMGAQRPQQIDERYRAQRLSGVFGDPVISNLMQQLRAMMGQGNVQLQGMEGGFRPAAGGPATPGFAADPASALLLQFLTGGMQPPGQAPGQAPQAPAAAPGADVRAPGRPIDTGTVPPELTPQLPQGAPPFTGSVPPALLPGTGMTPPVGQPTPAAPNPFMQIIQGIMGGMAPEAGGQIGEVPVQIETTANPVENENPMGGAPVV